MQIIATPVYTSNTKKQVKIVRVQHKQKWPSHIIASALSVCVGAATGVAIRALEQHFNIDASPAAFFLYILSWAVESEVRNEIIASMQGDMDFYQIEHKKMFMFRLARIASWVSYLLSRRIKGDILANGQLTLKTYIG